MPKLSKIPDGELTPLMRLLLVHIDELSNTNALYAEQIQQLKDEIATLKGRKAQGKFEPLKLEVLPCFSPRCFSKLIRTIQALEKEIHDQKG